MRDGRNERSPMTAGIAQVRAAALDSSPVSGLTHRFYRYPARFSPAFAAAAIEAFSSPGDLVLDPYMGGGTTAVEAMVRGRRCVGNDLNSLALFVATVKTTPLVALDRDALTRWADRVVPSLSYKTTLEGRQGVVCPRRTYNLTLSIARPIKKVTALALQSLDSLPSERARDFARCALLNTGQWALNGRNRQTPLSEFRERLRDVVYEMLAGAQELGARLALTSEVTCPPTLINRDAGDLPTSSPFSSGERADLVVTSPPYPGIHILYHRWQVDGRRETPAPYWIAACNDGQGASYYNFADRRDDAADEYFAESLRTLKAIRSVLRKGAVFVQMVAFGHPEDQLRRYLVNMEEAGFYEVRAESAGGRTGHRRIWRSVPGRRWHANLKGNLNGSREVVLIHQAR